jgi:hypothetical protein
MCAQQERDTLANLADNHAGLYEQHGWLLVSIKMYCATRWTGINATVTSFLRGWGALCVLKSTLIRDGYGHTQYNYHTLDEDEEDSDATLDEDEDADGQAGTRLFLLDNSDTGQPGAAKSK